MSKYDGPSYFKKNHPNVTSLNDAKKTNSEDKKVSWVNRDNYFKNEYEDSIPDSVETRSDLQEKALAYMQTPSSPLKDDKKESKSSDTFEKPYRFRSTVIPKSLQNLDGWDTNQKNKDLYAKVQSLLQKESNSYLLFEEYLAPELLEVLESSEPKEAPQKQRPVEPEKVNKRNRPIKRRHKKYNQTKQEKAVRLKEHINETVKKPSSGLHRSLSKIIKEDEEMIRNRKTNLGSLFHEED